MIYIYFLLHVNIECNGIYYPIMWILRHLLRRFFSSMFVSKFSHSDLDTFFDELIIWIAWMNSMWASECVCINIKALCTLTWFDVKKTPSNKKVIFKTYRDWYSNNTKTHARMLAFSYDHEIFYWHLYILCRSAEH